MMRHSHHALLQRSLFIIRKSLPDSFHLSPCSFRLLLPVTPLDPCGWFTSFFACLAAKRQGRSGHFGPFFVEIFPNFVYDNHKSSRFPLYSSPSTVLRHHCDHKPLTLDGEL